MTGYARAALLSYGFAFSLLTGTAVAQDTVPPAQPASTAADPRGDAYYNFAMAHYYGELANAYGNRGEYVNKAIEFYKQASKLDPSAKFVNEELCELYIQVGQFQKAMTEAEALIKQDPENINAHRILGRVYSNLVGGDQPNGKVNAEMLKSAIEQYKIVTDKNPTDTESLSLLARLLRASRDDAGAEQMYRKILAVDGSSEDALTGLAAVYSDRGDLKNGIDMLKRAVEKSPNPRTFAALAEFYEQARDFSHAADSWKQAIALAGENEELRKGLAKDLFEAGRTDEALKAYQDLAKDNPKQVEYQIRLTDLWIHKKEFANARASLAKAKALNNSPEIRSEEADILDAEEKTPQAITFVQGLLSETKKDQYSDVDRQSRIALTQRLAELQRKVNKTADAVATFRQISDLDPSLAPKVELAVVDTYARGKEFKQAAAASDSAVRKFPNDRALLVQRAGLFSETGRVDDAVKALNGLPNAQKDRGVQLEIASIYERAKRFEDEKRVLDQLEKTAAGDEEKTPVVFMRGAMYERMKNYDAAEKEFRAVLSKDPENSQALNYLGYMLADRAVRLDEAQKLIAKALEAEPENGAYLDSMGWVHYRQAQYDKAEQELRHALDRQGDDPAIHDHLGDVYFKQGKVKEAVQQWEASVSEYKKQRASEADPEELAKVAKKLESARVRISEKTH